MDAAYLQAVAALIQLAERAAADATADTNALLRILMEHQRFLRDEIAALKQRLDIKE